MALLKAINNRLLTIHNSNNCLFYVEACITIRPCIWFLPSILILNILSFSNSNACLSFSSSISSPSFYFKIFLQRELFPFPFSHCFSLPLLLLTNFDLGKFPGSHRPNISHPFPSTPLSRMNLIVTSYQLIPYNCHSCTPFILNTNKYVSMLYQRN